MTKQIITADKFAEIYNVSNKPIILDFYTDTCNPCKSLMPILERLAFEYNDTIDFVKKKPMKMWNY